MNTAIPKVFPSEFEGPPVTSAKIPPIGRQSLSDPTRRNTIISLVEMLLQQNNNNNIITGMLLRISLVV